MYLGPERLDPAIVDVEFDLLQWLTEKPLARTFVDSFQNVGQDLHGLTAIINHIVERLEQFPITLSHI